MVTQTYIFKVNGMHDPSRLRMAQNALFRELLVEDNGHFKKRREIDSKNPRKLIGQGPIDTVWTWSSSRNYQTHVGGSGRNFLLINAGIMFHPPNFVFFTRNQDLKSR